MTTIISGSSPSVTFSDSTTQASAGLLLTGGSITGNLSVSGNLSFNSGYGSSVIAYGCRAWVNFNGTGTPSIRASGNVSSITDNGTGLYTANFSTALIDANYSATVGANVNSSNDDVRRNCRVTNWSSSSVSVVTGNNAGSDSKEDFEFVTIMAVR